MPATDTLIMAAWILSMLGVYFAIRIMRKKIMRSRTPVTFGRFSELTTELKEKMDGVRCWQCGERYVGLALDCRCTNWGR